MKRLFDVLAGQQLTLREMNAVGSGLDLAQLRQVCAVAAELRYGEWDATTAVMRWFDQRAPEVPAPTLFDL